MILKKSLKMAPLILGIAAGFYYPGTDFSFNERLIKNDLNHVDFDPIAYNRNINSFGYEGVYLSNRIKNHYENWNRETLILSNVHAIVANNHFQQIVLLGERAVPHILAELKEQPSTLVWALNIILGKKISNSDLSISEASKAWVKWGIKNRLIQA